jgi:DNA-binding MarR family transcriptional regulator
MPRPTESKEQQQLFHAMRMLSTQSIMLHQVVADMLGLSLTDYKCMDLIENFGSMTAGRLAELTGLTTGAITGVVDRLEKAGYARRADNPKDRRSVIIELLWDKKNIYQKIFLPLEQKFQKQASSYSEKEIALFIDFVKMTVKTLHEETERLSRTWERKITNPAWINQK